MSNVPSEPRQWQPAELLQYLPAYKVVICACCKYAIQPQGIARHLKDLHHIHRGHRRPFMQYVSTLLLDPPDQVKEVTASEFPVPLLPVQDGLQCMHDGCAHLCVSIKRMMNHWLSVHGCSGRADSDWRPVPLQTFFRGNLIRYFTCVSPSGIATDDDVQHGGSSSSTGYSHGENTHLTELGVDDEALESSGIPNVTALLEMSENHLRSQLDEADAAFLNHYITSTSLTLATDDRTKALWQSMVPHLATRFPFLLHGILACAALHLAHLNPPQQREFRMRAAAHQDLAMPTFRSAIAKPDKDNCDAVFVFSHLLVIYSFSAELEDERLLLVESNSFDVLPSWLYFIRSGCSMLCDFWSQLQSGPVSSLISAWEIPLAVSVSEQTHLLDSLLSVIPPQDSQEPWSEEVCKIYGDAALDLGLAFSCTRDLSVDFTTWDALRIWPMRISDKFLDLLSQQHPGALILVAHYCILLQRLDSNWYFEGRAERLLSTVLTCLDERWHGCMEWPLAEIKNKSLVPRKTYPPRKEGFDRKLGSFLFLSDVPIYQ